MEDKGYKFYLEADLKEIKPTDALAKEVASVIDLPAEKDRQPDLSYFSSIFVSTGTNLNNAHFLTSEILQADDTISFKAVDIEHEEDQIIGHIYSHAYTDLDGKELSSDFVKREIAELDKDKIHVEIGSVLYKARFPQIAQEVAEHKWKVSMEAYYRDFDILVGSSIMTKEEAAVLGFDYDNELSYGQNAQVVRGGKVVAEGKIAKVLRGICFSGVGIVKNPANPPSVVLETTAGVNNTSNKDSIVAEDPNKGTNTIIFNYDNLEQSSNNNVTLPNIEGDVELETSELIYNDSVGNCVSYKKEVTIGEPDKPDSQVVNTNWCAKYERSCTTSPLGDSTSSKCLRVVLKDEVYVAVSKKFNEFQENASIDELTNKLTLLIKQDK